MAKYYNRHHALWQRREYTSPLEKAFRQHDGLVVPMYLNAHSELHARVAPPPKLPKIAMENSIYFLDTLDCLDNPLATITALTDHLADQESGVCTRLAKNLMRQMIFIEPGIVR